MNEQDIYLLKNLRSFLLQRNTNIRDLMIITRSKEY